MKKFRAKASSLPIFNGRITDATTLTTTSLQLPLGQTPLRKQSSCTRVLPTVFTITDGTTGAASTSLAEAMSSSKAQVQSFRRESLHLLNNHRWITMRSQPQTAKPEQVVQSY